MGIIGFVVFFPHPSGPLCCLQAHAVKACGKYETGEICPETASTHKHTERVTAHSPALSRIMQMIEQSCKMASNWPRFDVTNREVSVFNKCKMAVFVYMYCRTTFIGFMSVVSCFNCISFFCLKRTRNTTVNIEMHKCIVPTWNINTRKNDWVHLECSGAAPEMHPVKSKSFQRINTFPDRSRTYVQHSSVCSSSAGTVSEPPQRHLFSVSDSQRYKQGQRAVSLLRMALVSSLLYPTDLSSILRYV